MFFSFVALFEIGSLICGVAPSSTVLVIGRAIAGIGGSGLFSGGLTILALSLPKARRSRKSIVWRCVPDESRNQYANPGEIKRLSRLCMYFP
jgi:MFS family permease